MELDLLLILSTKDNYERYCSFIQRHTVTTEVWQIITDLAVWYDTNDELDWDSFATWFKVVKHPTFKEEKLQLYQTIFNRVKGHTTTATTDEIVEALLARDYGTRITDISRRVAEGEDTVELEDIEILLEEYAAESDRVAKLDSFFVDDDVANIFEHVRGGTGLNWRLPFLNYSCGPIRKGDFIILSARPDSGKTTALASESTFMAPQLQDDQVIVWFNNEEEGRKVKYRVMQAALGWDNAKMEVDMDTTWEKYIAALGGDSRIKIVDNKRMDVRFVENILKKVNPGLIIFDQLWKISGFEKESVNETDRQTKLFGWGRELAGLYAPVINVHQADGSAEGQLWIEMNQLYGSKCLAKGTKVRLFDGEVCAVEDIKVGDTVMGMDSTPRKVTALGSGTELMYRITHKNGLSYTVNESHILTLKKTTEEVRYGLHKGDVVDVELKTLLDNPNMLNHLKGFTTAIQYTKKELLIDPYIFGLWLSDGKAKVVEWATKDIEFRNAIKDYAIAEGFEYKEHTDGSCWYPRLKHKQGVKHPYINKLKHYGVYGNKFIPNVYKTSSIEQRLQLLAGLIDGDGNIVRKHHDYYEVCVGNNSSEMAEDIREIAISVGLNATIRNKKTCYVVHISGDVCDIPVRIARKKTKYRSKRDVTVSTLSIEEVGIGEYYGFTVDKDSRYMLANYIPTHNTGIQGEADAIITLGRSHESGYENIRGLYVPKNKLAGGAESVDALRNGKQEVIIKPSIARFEMPRVEID